MSAPYPNPHSPDERRLLSNIGHVAEGGILGVASGLALADAVNPDLDWPGRWWPRVVAGAGVALGGFILVGSAHHGGPRRYLKHEHQDRQHVEMAALVAAGGLIEVLAPARVREFGWPAAMTAVGTMFVTHEQHGDDEARRKSERTHRILGASSIATGAAKAAAALRLPGPWKLAWPIAGIVTSAQLVAYREPTGAYE